MAEPCLSPPSSPPSLAQGRASPGGASPGRCRGAGGGSGAAAGAGRRRCIAWRGWLRGGQGAAAVGCRRWAGGSRCPRPLLVGPWRRERGGGGVCARRAPRSWLEGPVWGAAAAVSAEAQEPAAGVKAGSCSRRDRDVEAGDAGLVRLCSSVFKRSLWGGLWLRACGYTGEARCCCCFNSFAVTPCVLLPCTLAYAGRSVGVKRRQKEEESGLGGLVAERSNKFLHYWAMLIKGAHLLAEISQTTGKEKNPNLFIPALPVGRSLCLESFQP